MRSANCGCKNNHWGMSAITKTNQKKLTNYEKWKPTDDNDMLCNSWCIFEQNKKCSCLIHIQETDQWQTHCTRLIIWVLILYLHTHHGRLIL